MYEKDNINYFIASSKIISYCIVYACKKIAHKNKYHVSFRNIYKL